MQKTEIRRGDIFYANLEPVFGSETGKTRPVLIIQNDIGNKYASTTIVAVITEYSEKKASLPICVSVGEDEGELKKKSIVNLSQIRTIDKRRLQSRKIGTLTEKTMRMVDMALKNSLALI
jgi:mRNA interferase MazF